MEKFAGTKTDIFLKNHHTWGCPVYVLDSGLQGDIAILPKWEPHSHAGNYFYHSPFHAVSVTLVINRATFHVSPQSHMVFDDDFSTITFMREVRIPPNWTDLV